MWWRLLGTNLMRYTYLLISNEQCWFPVRVQYDIEHILLQIDTSDEEGRNFHNLLHYISEQSLTLAMSQCLLILKHPDVSPKHKHMLKRELGDEMVSVKKYYNTLYTERGPPCITLG